MSQYLSIVTPSKYAPSTLDMYMGYYHKHIEPIFIGKLLKDIEPICIQIFMQTLPEINLYGARHSFASNAIAAGIEPSAIAEMLGHTGFSTTYDKNAVHNRCVLT